MYTNMNEVLASYTFTAKDRFLRYVQIDTQSDPLSKTIPSTDKQKNLGRLLVEELLSIGINDAHMDEYGYVYGTVPATTPDPGIPVICFCSHMDTSPDCSGFGVKPIIHANYQGQDLVLPDDSSIVIRRAEHPELSKKIGHDIITASGTTLLGADNKAGVAAIMDAVSFWMTHPECVRGTIKILFTPDEEIGRGVDKVDLIKLGAHFAYTIDGESAGSVENETFSADALVIKVFGKSAHPGFAKNNMVSALKLASSIISHLPKGEMSPETTEGKEPFIHPVSIQGNIEQAEIQMILRSFRTPELADMANLVRGICEKVVEEFPGARYELNQIEQYRNMKEILDHHPQVVDHAIQAVRESGLEPVLRSIRGGTDGSRLSFMGLPCPNIFAGEHAFHSKQEWVTVQDMQKSTETIIRLAGIWASSH
jgi:tripeptide aminopeptidase